MKSVTVSAKYQVVIPKELRRKLTIKPGQRVFLEAKQNGDIIIKSRSAVDSLYGSLAGQNIWGSGPDGYVRKNRDNWGR